MNEFSIKYPTKLYEFISGRWAKHIVYIKAESASTALNTYCKNHGKIKRLYDESGIVSHLYR